MFTRKSKLRSKKLDALYEAKTDLRFFETVQGEHLRVDENKLREELAKENKIREKDPKKANDKKIAELSDKITKSQATKNAYKKTLELVNGLQRYIDLL